MLAAIIGVTWLSRRYISGGGADTTERLAPVDVRGRQRRDDRRDRGRGRPDPVPRPEHDDRAAHARARPRGRRPARAGRCTGPIPPTATRCPVEQLPGTQPVHRLRRAPLDVTELARRRASDPIVENRRSLSIDLRGVVSADDHRAESSSFGNKASLVAYYCSASMLGLRGDRTSTRPSASRSARSSSSARSPAASPRPRRTRPPTRRPRPRRRARRPRPTAPPEATTTTTTTTTTATTATTEVPTTAAPAGAGSRRADRGAPSRPASATTHRGPDVDCLERVLYSLGDLFVGPDDSFGISSVNAAQAVPAGHRARRRRRRRTADRRQARHLVDGVDAPHRRPPAQRRHHRRPPPPPPVDDRSPGRRCRPGRARLDTWVRYNARGAGGAVRRTDAWPPSASAASSVPTTGTASPASNVIQRLPGQRWPRSVDGVRRSGDRAAGSGSGARRRHRRHRRRRRRHRPAVGPHVRAPRQLRLRPAHRLLAGRSSGCGPSRPTARSSRPTASRAGCTSRTPARTRVYSRSMYTYSTDNPDIKWRYMVRFAYGPGGGRIGFHEIPTQVRRAAADARRQLGQPLSGGCVRQSTADAAVDVELGRHRHQGRRALTPRPVLHDGSARTGRFAATVRRSQAGETASIRRLANDSLCCSSFERLSSQAADHVGAGAPTAPVSLSRLLPGLRANVQKAAARLPRIAGRLEIVATRPRRLADDEQPVHPGADEHDVGLLDRGEVRRRAASSRPVIVQPSCCRSAAISSAAFHVFPVRLSTSRAAFMAADSSTPRRSTSASAAVSACAAAPRRGRGASCRRRGS